MDGKSNQSPWPNYYYGNFRTTPGFRGGYIYSPYGVGYGGFDYYGGYHRDFIYYGRGFAQPPKLTDQQIRDNVEFTINSDPAILKKDKDSINVSVKDGIVTLSGTVRRKYSKWQAESDAFWNVGVKNVQNNLVVQKPER